MGKNKIKPTKRQKKTLEIKQANPDMPLGEAMRQAGYSETTSQAPSANFLDLKGTQTAIEEMKNQLVGLGITPIFMANKYKEWLTAQKPFSSHTEPDKLVPDYDTQLKVKDDINKLIGLTPKEDSNLKKRIVAEEFFQ